MRCLLCSRSNSQMCAHTDEPIYKISLCLSFKKNGTTYLTQLPLVAIGFMLSVHKMAYSPTVGVAMFPMR